MNGWVGLEKSYVITGVGHAKILRLLTRWVGGSKKDLKYAYVIFEWSLTAKSKQNSVHVSKFTVAVNGGKIQILKYFAWGQS